MNKEVKPPFWVNLYDEDDKTLIVVYPWCGDTLNLTQQEVGNKLIEILGDPEFAGSIEGYADKLIMVFPHRNLPPALMNLAEKMTSSAILNCLDKGIPIRGERSDDG